MLEGLRTEGFVNPGHNVDPDELISYLNPFLDPARNTTFHFSRAWLREQAARVGDPRTQAAALGRQLNLPPSYLLIHRVWHGPFQAEMRRWVPGLAPAI